MFSFSTIVVFTNAFILVLFRVRVFSFFSVSVVYTSLFMTLYFMNVRAFYALFFCFFLFFFYVGIVSILILNVYLYPYINLGYELPSIRRA